MLSLPISIAMRINWSGIYKEYSTMSDMLGLPWWLSDKNLPAVQKTWIPSLGRDDPLEEGMATYSSILAWRIPLDRGAWRATVHRVAQGQTQLKWLSSRSSSCHAKRENTQTYCYVALGQICHFIFALKWISEIHCQFYKIWTISHFNNLSPS